MEQYKDAIDEFCLDEYESEKECIAATLLSSEETFRSVLLILDSMNDAKALLIRKLFEEIEVQIESLMMVYGLRREETYNWYEYRD